jgi:mannose/fructose/sorbose-specific phosphotransferase system IIA component
MTYARSFRILVVSHGRFAEAMLESAAMICGELEDAFAVGLLPGQTPEGLSESVRAALGDDDRAVLILTDVLGGTPHNVASAAFAEARARSRTVACVSGINLGVLLEALTSTASLDPADVAALVERGRNGLVDVEAFLAVRRAKQHGSQE